MTYVPTRLKKCFSIDEIITIHYFEYNKDFIFHGERHDFWEFLYVDKGSINVYTDDTSYFAHSGDIIFHQPNEFHALKATGEKAPNLVTMSFICNDSAMDYFINKIATLNSRERDLISLILFEAKAAFTTPISVPSIEQVMLSNDAPFGTEHLIANYIENLLIEIRRNHSGEPHNSSVIPQQLHSVSHSQRTELVIDYMNTKLTEQLNIQDLCKHFSVSKSYLHNLFKSEKGIGVIEYYNQMKIEMAKDLIRSKSFTLTEIAHFLSFSSLQYFSKRFKLQTGMSPYEYSQSVKEVQKKLLASTSKNRTLEQKDTTL